MASGPGERLASGRQGNNSTTATKSAMANSIALHSTYSQVDNHYATTTANTNGGSQAGKPADISSRQANNKSNNNNNNNNNNNWIKTAAIASEVRGRRSTLSETLLANSLRDGKANRLLTCLLVAALCASVLNTLLLSFVIKSIQLNDGGFINGKLAWNEQLAATTLNSRAKLPGKSILVQSIESFGDEQALRIEKLSRASLERQQQVADDESLLFAIDDNDHRLPANSNDRQSNYMKTANWNSAEHVSAVEGKLDQDSGMLEIGAKSFALNLITAANFKAEAGKQREQAADDNGDVAHLQPTATERVLEFSGDRQSISLNREKSLSLSPAASGSLAVEGELWSPSITGSLAQNLDLQTRNGQLLCNAERTMKLVSKSGKIQLVGSEGIQLDSTTSGAISFHSKRLLIPTGIRYFDSEPPLPSGASIPTLVQEQQQQQQSIGAYELVAVNGLLMATS